jgi:L-arabinose isomerase
MKVKRRKKRTANIGIFGVGFHKYWPQFDGLLDELTGKLNIFIDKVKATQSCRP